MEIREKLKKANDEKKLAVGFSSVRESLLKNKLSEVIIASNCPAGMRSRIVAYTEELKTPLEVLNEDSISLGVLCKRKFKVCAVGIRK